MFSVFSVVKTAVVVCRNYFRVFRVVLGLHINRAPGCCGGCNRLLDKSLGGRGGAVMVGDSGKDVKAGQNAQVKTVVFYPPANQRFYSCDTVASWQADYVIKDFAKLLNL